MSHLDSQPGGAHGAEDSRRYLVVDATPIRWSLEATKVLRVMPLAAWEGRVADLDAALEAQREMATVGTVIVLQATHEAFAIVTRYSVHLESCEASELLTLPRLIFGGQHELIAARQLILRENATPSIVLDIDTLCQMTHTPSGEMWPQMKAGEPTS